MAITISSTRNIVRFDSTSLPRVATSGIDDIGYLKVADWAYIPITDVLMALQIPNRSLPVCKLEARNVNFQALTVSTGITHASGTLSRTGSDAYGGGYYNTALDGDNCSIQVKIPDTLGLCGISLQDGSGTITHEIDVDTSVAHAMILDENALGSIRELGQLPPSNAYFKYEPGDTAFIELIDGIVRYFLVKSDGSLRLIRSTRSKLTEDPKAEVMVYTSGYELTELYFWNGEAESTVIETVGVLQNFQDWFNDYAWISTADSLEMANKDLQFTYPSQKTRLRNLTANLNVRTKDDRDDFLAFFLYHGIEKEFLFVDLAHKDANNDPTEFWARFASPFGDKARSSCLSAHTASIVESYRNDFVPILTEDLLAPCAPIPIGTESISGDTVRLIFYEPEDDCTETEPTDDDILLMV